LISNDLADLSGKVALVTGASRSMGAGIARELARCGARVACLGRSVPHGEAVVADIGSDGGIARFIPVDLTDENSVRTAIARTVDTFGRLDFVVNNAAATDILRGEQGGRPVVEETTERFDQMMKVNLYAPFWLAKYGIPHIIAVGGGSIVSISSLCSQRVEYAMPAYSASKAAVEGLTRQIARDYAADNIRVNAIMLGSIRTDETAYLHDDPVNGPARRGNRMIGPPGSPADVGRLVRFLCSAESSYITASVIPLDGGASALYATPVISAAGPQPDLAPIEVGGSV
jgi:NAD(P)-dependent dehydrogenase (short-subunit alcohol dehydrogenase family)